MEASCQALGERTLDSSAGASGASASATPQGVAASTRSVMVSQKPIAMCGNRRVVSAGWRQWLAWWSVLSVKVCGGVMSMTRRVGILPSQARGGPGKNRVAN